MSIKALNWAFDVQNLSPSQKLVLIALSDHCSDDGECYPGIKRMERKTCLSRRAIQTAINALVDKKIVVKNTRFDEFGRQSSNIYRINFEQKQLCVTAHIESAANAPSPSSICIDEGAVNALTSVQELHPNHHTKSSNESINVVWDYFVQKIGSNAKFDDSRKRMIAARLKTFTVDELKLAVDGLASSKYHAGDNESGKTYQTPGHVFRSTDQVDKMREMIDKPKFHVESKTNKCSKCGVKSNVLMGKPPLCNECHAEKEKQDEILAARRFSEKVAQNVSEVGNGTQMPSELRTMVSSITNKTKI